MPGVNNDCYIHYYIQKQTTSIGDILVFPCTGVDTMADSSQFTQGGSKVRRSCQSTIVGGACTELRHSDRNLRTVWFEKEDFKKKHWVDFYHCRVDAYTHFQHTFMFKQQVNFASDDPFNAAQRWHKCIYTAITTVCFDTRGWDGSEQT